MKERKYIQENRDIFDDMEPTKGHSERFEALLKQQNNKQKTIKKYKIVSIISIAASIIILVAILMNVKENNQIQVAHQQENSISNDFQSINEYYKSQMQEQISDIMCKLGYTEKENQKLLTEDIQKIMDENSGFVEEMSKNEDKELAIHYLKIHYKANLQVLEDINEKLGKYTNC